MILFGDKFVTREQVNIDLEDRGYQFGDGVYEVIRVYYGKPFYLKDHMERLKHSLEEISIPLPYSLERLEELLEELIRINQLQEGNIYLQITRGISSPRNHLFPAEAKPVLTAYTIHADRPLELTEKGVSVITTEDIRWLRCDIKSLNLLPNVLAKQKAKEAGCFEALFVRNGVFTEGSSSNVFFVKGNELYTHPSNQLILHGITRKIILQIAEEKQIPVHFEALPVEELHSVDECFLTGTNAEVMPVIRIDEQKVGSGKPGPVTRLIQQQFEQKIEALKG
jgi:D-alanine transaminase